MLKTITGMLIAVTISTVIGAIIGMSFPIISVVSGALVGLLGGSYGAVYVLGRINGAASHSKKVSPA